MQTELDRIANQNHLQLFKALIPHLPASNRKRFSILIKIMEVQNVIRFYDRPRAKYCTGGFSDDGMSGGNACGASASGSYPDSAEDEPAPEPPDLLDILSDVRCYCEGEEQQMIDHALQMMSMIELFSMMAQEDSSPESGDCGSDSDVPPAENGSSCGSGENVPPPEKESG